MNLESLRSAIKDLCETSCGRYPQGKSYLQRVEALESSLTRDVRSAQQSNRDKSIKKLWREFESLQREALIANPLVSGCAIVFVVRRQYKKDHHNSATMFQTGEINTESFEGGSSLKTIDLAAGGKVKTLIRLPEGIVRDPEVHFSGKKIIFSMRRDINNDYNIYEIYADGTGLKQLTFGKGVTDIDPL
ncbi:MAG: TolB-like translocation protein, partial [Planctomycetota bacterium]